MSAADARRRLPAWIGLLVAALALLTVAAVDGGGLESDAERIQRLNGSYACPQCSGQSVAESNAAVAANIRQFIDDRVTAGADDQQIRDDLVAAYGVEVLLNPPAEGITTLVWVLPVVIVAVGAVLVSGAVVGNRAPMREVSAADRDLLARARTRRDGDGDADGENSAD
jgi:cytochrome c-type biogenesis protein CcmH